MTDWEYTNEQLLIDFSNASYDTAIRARYEDHWAALTMLTKEILRRMEEGNSSNSKWYSEITTCVSVRTDRMK